MTAVNSVVDVVIAWVAFAKTTARPEKAGVCFSPDSQDGPLRRFAQRDDRQMRTALGVPDHDDGLPLGVPGGNLRVPGVEAIRPRHL